MLLLGVLLLASIFALFAPRDITDDEIKLKNITHDISIAKSRIAKIEQKVKANEVASELNTKIRMLNKSITDDKEKIPEIELLK